ncbi:unnamed protein product [Strongylus vulgaris]|uniref:Uncharacterized protein n=1 Tax=Strongylus vulgaris TaxID=40348 RepID=A0A3P7LSJ0_STRVU|nr:unnamed protein product [Strongylus vulgaris]
MSSDNSHFTGHPHFLAYPYFEALNAFHWFLHIDTLALMSHKVKNRTECQKLSGYVYYTMHTLRHLGAAQSAMSAHVT